MHSKLRHVELLRPRLLRASVHHLRTHSFRWKASNGILFGPKSSLFKNYLNAKRTNVNRLFKQKLQSRNRAGFAFRARVRRARWRNFFHRSTFARNTVVLERKL